MKQDSMKEIALIALFVIAFFASLVAIWIGCEFIVETDSNIALAYNGEVVEVETVAEPSNGEKIRSWIYAEADSLIGGATASAIIAFIASIALAVVKKKIENKLVGNTRAADSLTAQSIQILAEARKINENLTSEVEHLKSLKKTEAIGAVANKAGEIVEQINELEDEPEEEDEADEILRS